MPDEYDIKFKHLTKGIDGIERRVAELSTKVAELAVHNVRIENLAHRVDCIWKKLDDKIFPQLADCPKSHIKWLWCTLIPLGFTQLALGIRLLISGN